MAEIYIHQTNESARFSKEKIAQELKKVWSFLAAAFLSIATDNISNASARAVLLHNKAQNELSSQQNVNATKVEPSPVQPVVKFEGRTLPNALIGQKPESNPSTITRISLTEIMDSKRILKIITIGPSINPDLQRVNPRDIQIDNPSLNLMHVHATILKLPNSDTLQILSASSTGTRLNKSVLEKGSNFNLSNNDVIEFGDAPTNKFAHFTFYIVNGHYFLETNEKCTF